MSFEFFGDGLGYAAGIERSVHRGSVVFGSGREHGDYECEDKREGRDRAVAG